jgi:serine/threonine-protein kinase
VYLAEDLRHDRKVALKVLKPELAAVLGAERFVVEIKTTAALQHPHILPLFDSGTADGFLYYVMPYIQGETLRSKLDRETQLGIEEAVKLTTAVADALDYAHRHGVIHRDIKPENILLHDGRPMVADFGIALAVSAAAGGRMTETGLSLGTPHYMSPEQATAEKELTARSDVYSLGCVLYEMLTGRPPHIGASAQQIIMLIVTEEAAPVTKLRKAVPPHVADAVATALEKLPADRFPSAQEFSAALHSPAYTRAGTAGAASRSATGGDWRRKLALPALVVAAAAVAVAGWALTRPEPVQPVARYRVALSQAQGLSGNPWSRLAVAPDGSRIVYVGIGGRGSLLYLRSRDQLDATALPGTDGALNPVFSPDGLRVAYLAGGEVRVIALAGGTATTITDSAVGLPGITWGRDGYIYYDHLNIGPLMRVPEAGGAAQTIGRLDSTKGELQHSWPDALPNGRGVLMTVSRGGPGAMGSEADEIGVLEVKTGTHRTLVRGIFARYAASGHLLFVTTAGTLMAAGFDQDRMELTSEPVPILEGVGARFGGGAVDLSVSETGTLWYTTGPTGMSGSQEAVWVTRDGSAAVIAPDWRGLFGDPALSPDGQRLAITVREGTAHVYIRELAQGSTPRLSSGGTFNGRSVWMPGGRAVAYLSNRAGGLDAYEQVADGSRPPSLLLDVERPIEEFIVSRDGEWLVYRIGTGSGARDLYARRRGADSSIALLASPADEASPALSPDGRWLAYVSTEAGGQEVFVRPFPNVADGRWQISTGGGREPVWAHSGRELFYRTSGSAPDSQMVMQVSVGPTFVAGARRALFPLTGYSLGTMNRPLYDVTPDGRRFVMIRTPLANRDDTLIVIENFFQELRVRVGRP